MILTGLGRFYQWKFGMFRFYPLPFDVKYGVSYQEDLLVLDYDGHLWLVTSEDISQLEIPQLSRLCSWTTFGLLVLTWSGNIAYLSPNKDSGQLMLISVPTPAALVDIAIVHNHYIGVTRTREVLHWPMNVTNDEIQSSLIGANILATCVNNHGCLMLNSEGQVCFNKIKTCYTLDLSNVIGIKLAGLVAYLLDDKSRIWMWRIQANSRPKIIMRLDIYNWTPFWESEGAPCIVSTLGGQCIALNSSGDYREVSIES